MNTDKSIINPIVKNDAQWAARHVCRKQTIINDSHSKNRKEAKSYVRWILSWSGHWGEEHLETTVSFIMEQHQTDYSEDHSAKSWCYFKHSHVFS